MNTFSDNVSDFLNQKCIAVTGVSSKNPDAANHIFKKFRDAQYEVYPINPNSQEVENTRAYPDLASTGKNIDAVVIASPPSSAQPIIEECIRLGIQRVWFHSSVNQGSLDNEAADYAEENGISVMRTGCPMMYIGPVDFAHKCMKWIFKLTGKIPRK